MTPMPKLENLFFAVCTTAIKNTSWKYSDFEKVKFVEGQLAALKSFVDQQPMENPIKEEASEEGVAIEGDVIPQEKKN